MKFLSDFWPLIVFFATYHLYGILVATAAMMAATGCVVIYCLLAKKSLPTMLIFMACMLGIFGGLTLVTGDGLFIQLRPTITSIMIAVTLVVGLRMNKLLAKSLMGEALEMSDDAWRMFTWRWVVFFLVLALGNEIARQALNEEDWVTYKVFGGMGFSIAFTVYLFPFLQKHATNLQKPSHTPPKDTPAENGHS